MGIGPQSSLHLMRRLTVVSCGTIGLLQISRGHGSRDPVFNLGTCLSEGAARGCLVCKLIIAVSVNCIMINYPIPETRSVAWSLSNG